MTVFVQDVWAKGAGFDRDFLKLLKGKWSKGEQGFLWAPLEIDMFDKRGVQQQPIHDRAPEDGFNLWSHDIGPTKCDRAKRRGKHSEVRVGNTFRVKCKGGKVREELDVGTNIGELLVNGGVHAVRDHGDSFCI